MTFSQPEANLQFVIRTKEEVYLGPLVRLFSGEIYYGIGVSREFLSNPNSSHAKTLLGPKDYFLRNPDAG